MLKRIAVMVIPFMFVYLLSFPGIGSQTQAQGEDVVVLFVDQKFHDELGIEIQRLADDIENDLSASTILQIIDVQQTTPEDIRMIIQNLYQNNNLIGSILIGDIPTAYWGDYAWEDYVSENSPTDAFYEDLDDGIWVDPDGNGIYNMVVDEDGDGEYDWFYKTWIGEHNREVWSGRLQPPTEASHTDRVEMLRNYLERNHQYRVGLKTYQRGMVYAESVTHNGDPSDGEDDYDTIYNRAVTMMDESWLFDRQAGDYLDFVWSDNLTQHRDMWLTEINSNYEYGFLNVHGSVDGQWFGESNWLLSEDYQNTPANTLLIDLASCSNGDFTNANYLGGWVLFKGDALVVLANTVPVFYIGTPQPNPDHRLLSLGLTLGEVRLTHVLSNDASVLLGDPTLRLREAATGPEVTLDKSLVVLPSEIESSLSTGYTEGGDFTLKNDGNEPVKVYYRIMSMTSINGRRPWGNSFQSSFQVLNNFWGFPVSLAPGESRVINVDFYYDGQSGAGTYRASLLLYTDSSTTPYFWIPIEKTLLENQEIFIPIVISNDGAG